MAHKAPAASETARSVAYTNYRLYKFAKYRRLAVSRGCQDVFNARLDAGEGIRDVLKDLMPDVYEEYRTRMIANQFRSAVNGLLKQGYEPEELITYIRKQK